MNAHRGHHDQKIGNQYLLEELIGQGSYAFVYKAHHAYLNTKVAIKLLRTNIPFIDKRQFMSQFMTEAQRIAQLKHKNIITVSDAGIDTINGEERPYFVMELLPEGNLLRNHPRNQRLPVETVVHYAIQIAEALQYAHDKGIVHCDVKPANILRRGPDLVLSDFGVSIVRQNTNNPPSLLPVVGTPQYMAPEHLLGYPVPASDQYSLATMIYEWLCGDYPFNFPLDATRTQIYQIHQNWDVPSLRDKKEVAITPDMEEVIMIALRKGPEERFKHIGIFAQALSRTLQTYHLSKISTILTPPSPQATEYIQIRPEDHAQSDDPTKPAFNSTSGPLPNNIMVPATQQTTSKPDHNASLHGFKWNRRYFFMPGRRTSQLTGIASNVIPAFLIGDISYNFINGVSAFVFLSLLFYLIVAIRRRIPSLILALISICYWIYILSTLAFTLPPTATISSLMLLWLIGICAFVFSLIANYR